jgi:general secretion pathway protein B
MSFILDALKKSEAERQRQTGPALLEMRVHAPRRRLPLWALAIGVLLLINIVVLGWLTWRHAPAAATSAAIVPSGRGTAATGTPLTGTAEAPAAPTSGPASGPAIALPAATPGDMGAAPTLTNPLTTSPVQDNWPNSAVPGAAPAPAGADPATAQAEPDNPADLAPAVNSAPATERTAPATKGLQNYAELNGKLPELRLDLHVYATRPAERYAFINMRKMREGDVTPEGVRVIEITSDGVVLDYRGTEFLLGHQ